MDVDTQNHLTTIRNLLTYRLHELQTEVHAAEMARRGMGAGGGDVLDRKDEAMQASLAAVDEAAEGRDLSELALVERALGRLDAGRYGDCVDCGEPLPLSRLLVQPSADRCVACQRRRERAYVG